MIDDIEVIAIIPARSGSKGLPRKNLKKLGGISLVGRAVRAAKASGFVDKVLINTDDEEIATEARRHGADAPYLRRPELATDQATTTAVIFDALERLGISRGYLVVLQPTSPLRTSQDVHAAIEICRARRAPAVVSVTLTDKSPHWMFHMGEGLVLLPIIKATNRPSCRQDAAPVYVLNGAVYVIEVQAFVRFETLMPPGTLAYVMPADRSIDVDTADDLERARRLFARGAAAPAAT